MPKVEIKKVASFKDWMESYAWIPNYSFRPTPPLMDEETQRGWFEKRVGVTHFALYEDGKAAALATSLPMKQNIRGKIFSMSGLFNVASHPAYRRKGYAHQVILALLKDLRSSFPVSTLYPFRESYYERLGYISFPQPLKASFKSIELLPILRNEVEGKVEVLLESEGKAEYLDFIKKIQQKKHGMGTFNHPGMPDKKSESWIALAKVEGKTVGLMSYTNDGREVTKFKMKIRRFYYHNPQGLYLLLDWIARHIDQTNDIEIWLPADEKPTLWLADLDIELSSAWKPGMARILNIADIGGVEVGEGQFTAQINDPFCTWNEGVWKFSSVNGKLQVSPGNKPDCQISIQALTSLLYGTHKPDFFQYRGWGNPSKAFQAEMTTMFPGKMPFLHEMF